MSWPSWFTSLGPPLFFWVMLALVVVAFAGAVVGVLRKRYAIATVCVAVCIVVGLVILVWGNMGAFCVAPPGSACA